MPCELTAETSFSRQPQRLGQGRRRGACRQHRKACISVVTGQSVFVCRVAGAACRCMPSTSLFTALTHCFDLCADTAAMHHATQEQTAQ